MTQSIRLVPVQAEDSKMIWNLQRLSFMHLFEKYGDGEISPAVEPLSQTQKRLASPEHSFYFIEISHEIVGAMEIKQLSGDTKELFRLFILPPYQNKGIAQKAIAAAEALHGHRGWVLDTIAEEARLCHLYEKMGYLKTGKTKTINEKMTLSYYQKA